MIIVMIEWRDAARYVDSEWKSADDEYALIPMTTFGVLVMENEKLIAVAQDFSSGRPYSPYRGVMIVPKVNIVKVTRFDSEQEGSTVGAFHLIP